MANLLQGDGFQVYSKGSQPLRLEKGPAVLNRNQLVNQR